MATVPNNIIEIRSKEIKKTKENSKTKIKKLDLYTWYTTKKKVKKRKTKCRKPEKQFNKHLQYLFLFDWCLRFPFQLF